MIKRIKKWFSLKQNQKLVLVLVAPGGLIVALIALFGGKDKGSASNITHSPSVSIASNTKSTVSVNQAIDSHSVSGNTGVVMLQSTGTVNYYTTSDPTLRLAIEALEFRLRTNSETVELTRKDVRLLAEALRELDNRTKGFERLPDGRAKLGDHIVGQQTFVTSDLALALNQLATNRNPQAAYAHFSNAISRWERSVVPNVFQGEPLMPYSVASMYQSGAMSALTRGEKVIAKEWAEKATLIHPTIDNRAGVKVFL